MKKVETAPHHAWKKLSALMMTLALILTLLPAALAVDLNVDVGLASAAMMLRRRAYLDGLDGWVDVTENSIKSTAWSGGLSHSFTYNAMHVGYATLPSGKAAKTEALIQILAEHPEGIVLYDRRQPHAVLLTDYTDGVFYCSDPANGVSAGRVPTMTAPAWKSWKPQWPLRRRKQLPKPHPHPRRRRLPPMPPATFGTGWTVCFSEPFEKHPFDQQSSRAEMSGCFVVYWRSSVPGK